MVAAHDEDPAVLALRYALPHELWMMIHRHATAVPRALDTSLRSSLDLSNLPENAQVARRLNLASMATKLSIHMVCKAWQTMSRECLFEYISVVSEKALVKVSRLLQMSSEKALASEKTVRPMGDFVKRLDFFFTNTWSESALRSTITFIDHCPNLMALTEGLTSGLDVSLNPTVPNAIFQLCGPSVRRLEWKFTDFAEFDVAELFLHLNMAPNLESLSLLFISSTPKHDDNPLPHVFLPKLHTFEGGYWSSGRVMVGSAEWEIPNLKRLILTISPPFVGKYTFMDVHGPKIESLEVSTDTPRLIMPALIGKCPAIQEVSFGVDLEPVTVISVPLERLHTIGLTGLRLLGVDINDEGRLAGCLRSKCEKITNSLACIPALHVLRLVDFDPSQFKYLGQKLEDAQWWEEQVGHWGSLNIRLEDKYGNLIIPPDGASGFISYAQSLSQNNQDSDSSSSSTSSSSYTSFIPRGGRTL